MSGKSSNLKRRAWFVLGFVFLIGFGILIVRLFQLQVVEGPYYKAKALQQRTSSDTLEPKRGTIYDRNEKILAQSAVVWNVFISPAEMKEEQVADIAINLGSILEIPPEDILEAYQDRESLYKRIKMKINSPKRQEVENYIEKGYGDARIKGVYFEESTKRYYVFDNLASTVIGFVNEENNGVYGLEAYYDTMLSGMPGINISTRNAQNLEVPGGAAKLYEAQDGHSIVLTIDETIQGILEKHLEMAVVEHGVKNRAVGIIINIKTGEILGMSTKPDFNPNDPWTIDDEGSLAAVEQHNEGSPEYSNALKLAREEQWTNKAVTETYEPGSVYKIVTAAIALEENKSYLDDYFYCSGIIEVADRDIKCHLLTGHGEENFFDIMKNSCNPAFVTLGMRNGPEDTYNYMADFGLGTPTGIDLPGEVAGVLHSANSLASQGRVPLASTSFGQSFTTTPLQLITAVSAAVNGGYLVEPYVVRQIRDSNGNVIETIQPQIKRQVISEETSKQIQQLVETVVSDGTGKHAAIPGYRIGGKTGTSEILTAVEGSPKEYVLSFVGFAPMDDPVYACLVALDEPVVDNPLGSVIAAPVVGAIFQEMLPYVGVEPFFTEQELAQMPIEVPYLIGKKPHDAQSELTALGLKTKIVGQGSSVLLQIPLADQSLSKGGSVILFTDDETLNSNISVPDLEGMSVTEAKEILENLQLNVEVKGITNPSVTTVVKDQWPVSGASATTADIVVLTMAEDKSGHVGEIMPDMVPVPKPQVPSENKWDDVIDGEIQGGEDKEFKDFVEPTPDGKPRPEQKPPVVAEKEEKVEPAPSIKNKTGEVLDGSSPLPSY